MKIIVTIIRFFLALLFIYVAIDKTLNPAIPENEIGISANFITFYTLLLESKFIFFVCFIEFLSGALLLFKRTYLLGAIMLVPLLLCLLMIHVFISKSNFYLIFDGTLFLLNSILIIYRFKDIKIGILKPQYGWI
tara:strand:+ start:7089 stop:7493 length:405 start_codon:yes stop_codon:yes gene_type:complete